MTQRRKAGCRQLNMWHQKRDPFVGSQAPPHRGILILKCPPFHHKIMCQNTRSRQTRPAHFNFLFVCQTAGELPNMSAASQREALAVGERIVPRGGEPTTTTFTHKKKRQMASESHVLNFFPPRMLVILLVGLRQLMSRWLNNKDSANCDTCFTIQ